MVKEDSNEDESDEEDDMVYDQILSMAAKNSHVSNTEPQRGS